MERPCEKILHEKVCVEAKVKISPEAELGDVRSFCVDEPEICSRPGTRSHECSFFLRQLICLEIPVEFSAEASVGPAGIVCGMPKEGPCDEEPDEEPYERIPDDGTYMPDYCTRRRKKWIAGDES